MKLKKISRRTVKTRAGRVAYVYDARGKPPKKGVYCPPWHKLKKGCTARKARTLSNPLTSPVWTRSKPWAPITFRHRESTDDVYSHIDGTDKQSVVEKAATVQKWLEDQIARQAERPENVDPVLTSGEEEG
jgi:heat shock protein 4